MSATALPKVGVTTSQILEYTREPHIAFPFQRSAKGGSRLTYLSKVPIFSGSLNGRASCKENLSIYVLHFTKECLNITQSPIQCL